jgi:hypothetical protein
MIGAEAVVERKRGGRRLAGNSHIGMLKEAMNKSHPLGL